MKRILLAEDDADDQEIFREVVSEIDSSIKVSILGDGQKLLRLVETLPDAELPDLIILDQNMPVLKGNETIAMLRNMERMKQVPTVIYSTYHDPKFTEDCKRQNIELFLKPDTYPGLREMVSKLIARYLKRGN